MWLKDVNFLADTVTGRAESTLKLVEDLQQILLQVESRRNRGADHRRAGRPPAVVSEVVREERRFHPGRRRRRRRRSAGRRGPGRGKAVGATLCPAPIESAARQGRRQHAPAVEEVRKARDLRRSPASEDVIEEADVAELTPNVAEGDFFEAAEAFFSGDLKWTLAALQRHFFAGGDARPVISALQNRNRILLQIRALVDAGEVRVGPRGV